MLELSAFKSYLKATALASAVRPYRRDILFRLLTEEDRARRQFYRQFVKRGDLAFDVGANMGNRTKIFLKLGARVVAFEPQPGCAAYLESVAGRRRKFHLVKKALGPAEGHAEMMISDASTLSSLSTAWVEATKASGRFAGVEWGTKVTVQITTLDKVIGEYGMPAFIKIDVEGFELEVLRGLTRPAPCISIEFTAEYIEHTCLALDHLASLGPIETQLSYGESMDFALPEWRSHEEMKRTLRSAATLAVGDVYIRSLV